MKKISNILLAVTFALPLFTACETDNDSNPILNEPDTFTLNTPAYAANNVYDLKNAQTVELTCSQPDYGFPAATTYTVQASFEQDFIEATDESKANYTVLESTSPTAKINVDASELNNALLDLWTAVNGEQAELPTEPVAVYVRLKANITSSGKGVCFSNVIELPNVLISKSTSSLTPPKTMFVVGSMLDADWKVWKPMAGVYGMDGQFYSMIYFDANSEFKFGTKENEYIGINDNRVTVTDKAGAGVSGSDNFVVENAGWYLLYVKGAVKGDDYQFTITFYPAEVYLFGNTTGGSWAFTDEWKFAVPATKDGNFVSPAMTASGEVRMCFKTDLDWWRTEFTLHDGEIFYRDFNLIDSWTEKGDGYSVQGSAGNVIHLNFTAGKGEKKMIRQLSVFVENEPGSMMRVTSVLTESHINIRAISTFDTPEFGIMRLVVDEPECAKESLTAKGFVTRITEVVGAELKDEKGNLNRMLTILADGEINVNYIYSFVIREGKAPVIVFHTDDFDKAQKVLEKADVKLVEEEDL